ncbi:MAG: tetratricopeptide repeat protein [bacterium]
MNIGRLSVTMICFNHAHYIADTLENILDQSFKPIEIIIVDDGSTDASSDILQELAKKNENILLKRNEKTVGRTLSRKLALSLATGEYVYNAHFENKMHPDFFEKSMKLLADYPQAGLCCTHSADFSDAAQKVWCEKSRYFSPLELAEILMGYSISDCTCIINRSVIDDAGGWGIPELRWHSDWFLTHVIAFRRGICYIPESFVTLPASDDSPSFAARKNINEHKAELTHLVHLLKSPVYRDILPHFVRSSIMSYFGDEIVRIVMRNPDLWDPETVMLIQNPLWQWNLRLAKRLQNNARKSSYSIMKTKAVSILDKGNAAMAQGKVYEAFEIFKYLTRKVPTMAMGHVALYKAAIALEDYDSAREAVLKAIALEPNNAEFQNQLGIIYYRCGDYKMAENIFQKSLSLDPNNFNTYINLGEILRRQRFYTKAEKYYQKALKLKPDNVNLLVALGLIARETHSYESAQNYFERALSLDPSCEMAREALKDLKEKKK